MLLLRVANATKGRAETHTLARIGRLRRVGQPAIFQGKQGTRDGKLGITVQTPKHFCRKVVQGIKRGDLSGRACIQPAKIEASQWRDTALLSKYTLPERLLAYSNTTDGANSRYHGAGGGSGCFHFVTSRSFLNVASVRGATQPIMKSPMIGFAIGDRSGQRKFRSCSIVTWTPSSS